MTMHTFCGSCIKDQGVTLWWWWCDDIFGFWHFTTRFVFCFFYLIFLIDFVTDDRCSFNVTLEWEQWSSSCYKIRFSLSLFSGAGRKRFFFSVFLFLFFVLFFKDFQNLLFLWLRFFIFIFFLFGNKNFCVILKSKLLVF